MVSQKRPSFSLHETAPLFFAILIDILGFGLVYPVLTALFTSAHSSILPPGTSQEIRLWYLSLGFLLYPLFMFFGSSFMGDLSDILGRKKVLLICIAGLCLGFVFMGAGVKLSSIALILIGRSVSGLMSASMPTALAAIVDISTPENKAVHMSYVALVQAIGFVLGPFMGGVLSDPHIVSFFDFSVPFFASALLSFFAFIWIFISFEETETAFAKKSDKKINPMRLVQIFVQAFKHPAIRIVALVFLFMQIGIGLYLQLILIYYKETYHYSSLKMGIFNAFIGLWFAIGLLLLVPYMTKHYRVESIALVCLLITGISQFFAAIIPYEVLLWLIGIPLAIAVQVAWTTMLTSFSNAADANSQGWAMGVSGSIVALSFALTGLSHQTLFLMWVLKHLFF